MNPAIEIHDGFRIYDAAAGNVAALRGLDLSVSEGEIVAILGPSGSGKSTLLRVLAGLDQLSAGRAHVLGIDLAGADRAQRTVLRRRALGLLDQHYARSLSADLTCGQTVALQLGLLGHDPAATRETASALLAQVGLGDRAGDRPAALSGGEQQRVAVCAAVAHRPKLLLADEPAGELDADNAAAIYELLAELVHGNGGTALIVSHDPGAAAIADRLVYLQDGRIVEETRRSKPRALVVGRGWVHLPTALLRELGEPGRVVAQRRGDELVIAPADGRPGVVGEPLTVANRGAPAGPVAASLQRVTKSHGTRVVLEDFSYEFHEGVFVAVVGPSGSGKTTLLHLLAGLDRASSGTVEVAGSKLESLTRGELAGLRRRTIALVTQEPGLVPFLTAMENVELGLQLREHSIDGAREALAAVGLEARLRLPVARMSAGERQRVALARALAVAAPVLLVDEPTARLDSENAELCAALLAEAAHTRNIAVICATHDPAVIESADEVIPLGMRARRSDFATGRAVG